MNSGKLFKSILIGTILIITFGGFLWNCTFSMDTSKYPDRLTCGVNQCVNATTYIMTKYADYLKTRMERKIEKQKETLSGASNNFQSRNINK